MGSQLPAFGRIPADPPFVEVGSLSCEHWVLTQVQNIAAVIDFIDQMRALLLLRGSNTRSVKGALSQSGGIECESLSSREI